MYQCFICKRSFNSTSFDELNLFCKHVASCPVRSENFLVERYTCNLCELKVKHSSTFKKHLMKCQPPSKSRCNEQRATKSNTTISKQGREKGEFNLNILFSLIIILRLFPAFDKQRCVIPVNPSSELDFPLSTVSPQDFIPSTSSISDATTTNETSTKSVFSTNVLKAVTKIFSRTNVSMDGAEAVMKDVTEIVDAMCDQFEQEIESTSKFFPSDKQQQVLLVDRVKHTSEKIRSSLQSLNTEQKLKTALIRKNVLELPERVTFNEKVVQIEDSLKTIKSEAILLPIEHQIKSFLERPGVLQAIIDYQKNMEDVNDGTIKHFLNGTIWKNVKTKFEGTVIPLYNDDFAPDDTRSPHGSSNKISAFYSSFPSLPPKYNSALDSILVLMLAKSEEVKEVGANKLLGILANTLKPLEDNGIEVNGQKVYIAPVLLMGDNLGMNMNLGFPMNFSKAKYYCRFCFMINSQCEIACKEIENLIRTEQFYEECLKNLGMPGKNFGIVSKCDLDLLKSFSVTNNFSVDVMHDLLSGVFNYGIQQIIKKGITDKLFTLVQFNTAKNEFDYGPKEAHYIMENITSPTSQEYSIHCHAREMWCLIKFLPFILKKILPENHCIFKYGLMLVDLLDMCFKNSFSNSDLNKLKTTVTLHNREFLRLFSEQNPPRLLTAKFHFLLHYARVIQNSGPLKHLWSMRFEAKHQHMKSQAKIMYSRRNICYSFAKKICFENASNNLDSCHFIESIKYYSKSNDRFLENYETLSTSFINCKRVNLHGTTYALNDFVISNCSAFAYKILQIAIDKKHDKSMLIVEKFSLKYIQVLRSFKLCESYKEIECYASNHFKNPPLNSHLFEKDYYLRKEDF